MCKHTVKELKKIIMNYKKENCPAVSRVRRDELLKIIEKLEIEVDQIKTLPQDLKKMFKKNEKLLNYSTKIPKSIKIKDNSELKKIGGKELLKYIDDNIINDNVPNAGVYGYTSSRKSIKLLTDKMEELFPLAYKNIKKFIEESDKKTLLNNIDLSIFFNKNFLNIIKKKLIYINDFHSFIKDLFYSIHKNNKFGFNQEGPKRKIVYDKYVYKPEDDNIKITI